MKKKRRQFIISLLILAIGIAFGLKLGFWISDYEVNVYTVHEWSQLQEK